jgi:hypothetical protein
MLNNAGDCRRWNYFRNLKINPARLVGEHFRTQRRSNPHMWFPPLLKLKEHHKTIAQFDKGMEKIWSVWCKEVQCLVMGKLKYIKISSLKSLIVATLPLKYKEAL